MTEEWLVNKPSQLLIDAPLKRNWLNLLIFENFGLYSAIHKNRQLKIENNVSNEFPYKMY